MPMHLSVTRMNVTCKIFGLTLAAIGMQLIPIGQLTSALIPQASSPSNEVLVSSSRQINPQAQSEGDDPDMGDREGVPPSAGSGSR
jgi:hypothetical protein